MSVIEPHKVNTRANTIDGDSIGVFLTDDVAVNGAVVPENTRTGITVNIPR